MVTVRKSSILWLSAIALAVALPLAGSEAGKSLSTVKGTPIIWRDPGTGARDLYWGAGSEARQPHGPFKFLKEDKGGSSPKYVVEDREGVKWKVKLGPEVHSETAASRLVWAGGFFVNEDYFVPELHVEGIPARLKRHKMIEPGGVMRNARLKRDDKGEEKVGTWKWRDSPLRNTREWNGLRVMMALINNWDVKDENNAVVKKGEELIYMVSDLGATFGAPGRNWPAKKSKDNLKLFAASPFIISKTAATVDFKSPARASIHHLVDPIEFRRRLNLRWVGRDIPRADARWLGAILQRLSPAQIRDAFRAGGYSPDDAQAFAEVIGRRIGELNEL